LTYCNNWDFAVDGSPTNKTFIYPLNLPLKNCSKFLLTPPNNCNNNPFLISVFSQIEGATASINLLYTFGSFDN